MNGQRPTSTAQSTEASGRADFSFVRYAQCWEDADVLLEALKVQPGDVCLSIASAGDNSLSLLTRNPARVIAVDLNPAQLACLALRVAAYRRLEHPELLQLIGSHPSDQRDALYRRCRPDLDDETRAFWDGHPEAIAAGIGTSGKFESYFRLFGLRILPCIHGKRTRRSLIESKSKEERIRFYDETWNNLRWRLLFRVFFSRWVMGRFGRDPAFFTYVEGSVSDRILQRTRHAMTELDPFVNPYLQWIVTGRHVHALPHALREEHFDAIRNNLDRIEWRCASVETTLQDQTGGFDAFNLSDIFEYMSEPATETLLGELARAGRPGARLVYWNMLAPRNRPASLARQLIPEEDEATRLHAQDKAFFYNRLIIEHVPDAAITQAGAPGTSEGLTASDPREHAP